MGNMVGQAHPNVAVQPGLEQVCGCRCSVEYCQRLMGGVWWAHNGAPTMEGWLLGQYGYARVCVGGMECGLVVAEVSWGCAKSVVNLANFSHAHANPTIPQQIACLCEDLSLQATQGRAVCMDKLTQKRKFRW